MLSMLQSLSETFVPSPRHITLHSLPHLVKPLLACRGTAQASKPELSDHRRHNKDVPGDGLLVEE